MPTSFHDKVKILTVGGEKNQTQQVTPYSNQKTNLIVFWGWHEFGITIHVKYSMGSNISAKKINQVSNNGTLKNTLYIPMPRNCETADHKED